MPFAHLRALVAIVRKLHVMNVPEGITPAPEGALIRQARTALWPSVSATAAAKKAGVSASRWQQIERGWRWESKGVPIVDHPPAPTLAIIAAAVGVTPADLISVGRGDAAAELRSLLRAQDQAAPEVDLSQVDSDDLLDELRRRLREGAAVDVPHLAAAREVDPNDPSSFYQD